MATSYEKVRYLLWTNIIYMRAYRHVHVYDYDFTYNLFWIRLLSFVLPFLSQKYSYTCHTNETKLKPAIRPPSSSSSFAVYAGLLVRAKIYFLKALMCSLWLHQFSFTMPPPYFHEVKLVFANDPRTDIYAGSYIGVFNGKCRSSRFDDAYTRCLIIGSIIEKCMIFLSSCKQLRWKFVTHHNTFKKFLWQDKWMKLSSTHLSKCSFFFNIFGRRIKRSVSIKFYLLKTFNNKDFTVADSLTARKWSFRPLIYNVTLCKAYSFFALC
jgi:hypothetical protein